MALFYSTASVHPRDRVAYWREEVLPNLPRHGFNSSVGPAFVGEARLHTVADLRVQEFECNPCEIARTRVDISRCENDDLVLKIQLSGHSVTVQDGRQAVLEAGSCTLFDTSRPFVASHKTHERALYLAIPRRALMARLGHATALTARLIDTQEPLAGLATGFIKMLPEHASALEGPKALKIAEQTLDLLALAFSAMTETKVVALSSPRTLTLMRLKSAIEARLCDPDLRPAAAAAAVGISVRYANALFSHEGTSTERYITQRRLERCRDALDDPAQTHRTIGDIAFGWGFWDLSHFGRRFRDKFGLSPKDYRHRAVATRTRQTAEAAVATASL
jgi:AraC-like DNA-binding protein